MRTNVVAELNFLILRYLEPHLSLHVFQQLKQEITNRLPKTSSLEHEIQDYDLLVCEIYKIDARNIDEMQ